MKNNHGFSNILVISIALVLLGIGGYFGFKYFQNTDNKPAPVKIEITKFKPTISDKGTYFEIIDSNSSKKISIKLPKNVNLDTTYLYEREIKADTKKITKKEDYSFLDDESVGEEKSIYTLVYKVSKIVPQINSPFLEDCDGSNIHIASSNQSSKSLLDFNKNEISKYNIDPVIKESTVNNFKVYSTDQLPGRSTNVSTLIEIDENYTLEISNWCVASPEDKNNDVMGNVYNQIINSVSEVK